jgi:hypothetical protein
MAKKGKGFKEIVAEQQPGTNKKKIPCTLYGFKAKKTHLVHRRAETEEEAVFLRKLGWSDSADPKKNQVVKPDPSGKELEEEVKKDAEASKPTKEDKK